MISSPVLRAPAAALVALASTALAAAGGGGNFPYVIPQDIVLDENYNTFGGSYAGPVTVNDYPSIADYRGVASDGDYDAYDDAGILVNYPLTPSRGNSSTNVQISRQADALTEINVYRWVDTFTNITDSTVSLSVALFTNLGSDGNDYVALNDSFRFISFENNQGDDETPTDPVVAMMHGNNEWAMNNISLDRGTSAARGGSSGGSSDDVFRVFSLTLEPGQSASLMFADFLAYSPTFYEDEFGSFYSDPGSPLDVANAFDTTASFLADPSALFQGLNFRSTGQILNWTIPTPGAASLGAVAMIATLRRRRHA